jgi:hypothetical protein
MTFFQDFVNYNILNYPGTTGAARDPLYVLFERAMLALEPIDGGGEEPGPQRDSLETAISILQDVLRTRNTGGDEGSE